MTAPRPGFAFVTTFRVRYAEIDGQKVVFNSRYLEYADVAATAFWEWTGIACKLGKAWADVEFHVRRNEVDYLRPFVWGDTVAASVRIERVGTSSITQRYELANAATGDLHAVIVMTIVNVDLASGRARPIGAEVRAFLEGLAAPAG